MLRFELRGSWSIWALSVALCVMLGCSRKDSTASDTGVDAGFDANASTLSQPSAAPTEQAKQPDPEDNSVPAVEAFRKVVAKVEDDSALARQSDAILGFFKEDLPAPLAVQIETLPRRRKAILLPGKPEIGRPFVMVVDANGTRAWTKEMPLAGIVPGVRDIAIVRGTESSVGIAFCDSTGQRAALRMWHDDGSINADFEVMEVPHCDNISAIYIPGVGQVIGSTGETTARIGMIAENGMRTWDSTGISLPWTAMPHTALTIVPDANNSFIVIGVDVAEKEKRRPNDGVILAMRYNMQGREMWPNPIALGPRKGRTLERFHARVVSPGKVEVEIADKPALQVELTSNGVVMPLQ